LFCLSYPRRCPRFHDVTWIDFGGSATDDHEALANYHEYSYRATSARSGSAPGAFWIRSMNHPGFADDGDEMVNGEFAYIDLVRS